MKDLLVDLQDEVYDIATELRSNGLDPMLLGDCDIENAIMNNAEVDINDKNYYYDRFIVVYSLGEMIKGEMGMKVKVTGSENAIGYNNVVLTEAETRELHYAIFDEKGESFSLEEDFSLILEDLNQDPDRDYEITKGE